MIDVVEIVQVRGITNEPIGRLKPDDQGYLAFTWARRHDIVEEASGRRVIVRSRRWVQLEDERMMLQVYVEVLRDAPVSAEAST